MGYPGTEKLEIIRLVEQSPLPVRDDYGVVGLCVDSRSMTVVSVFRQRLSRSSSAWSSLIKSANLHSSVSAISF